MNEDTMAARLFGTSSTPAQGASAPAPSPEDIMAAKLFDAPTTAPTTPKPANRELTMAEKLFGLDEQPADELDAATPEAPEEPYRFEPIDGVELDSPLVAQFAEVAQSIGIPQDQAQQVLAGIAPKFAEVRQAWADETRADPDIGGDKLPAVLEDARQVLTDHDDGGEFRALLDKSGLGNHRATLKFLAKLQRSRGRAW